MLNVILSWRSRSFSSAVALVAAALFAPCHRAAAQVTVGTFTLAASAHAPTDSDISQPLFDAPTGTSYGSNDADYIGYEDYSNNPSTPFIDPNTSLALGGPGQIFTPTTDLALNTLTIKGGGGASSASTFSDTTWDLTIGSVSTIATGTNITVLGEYTGDASNVLAAGDTGYVTFALSQPIPLAAGTSYVYAIYGTASSSYFSMAKDDGAADGDVYPAGAAFLGDVNTAVTPNTLQTDYVHNDATVDPTNNPGGATDRTFFINGTPGASPITFSQTIGSWVYNGSGNWETPANWSSNPNVPGAIGSEEFFGSIGGSSQPVVTLSQPAYATLLDFQSPDGTSTGGYTINNGGSGSITISAQIEADSGSHTINVPVIFSDAGSQGSGGPIVVDPGASLTIPNASNSGVYGTFYLTADDGVSAGGTFSEGGMTYCSIDVAGTWNFLASNTGGEFFGMTAEASSLINVGNYAIFANALYGSGTVNIGPSGSLTLGYYNSTTYFSGAFTGSGSLIFTGLVFNSPGPGAAPQYLYADSPSFTGPITVNGGDTLGVQTNDGLGSGASTNTVTLDNGILQAIGSFTATQNIIITANGGTIDTDGPAGGTGAIIPGGTAITLGTISSAANGTLTKINDGQLTAAKITGVSLIITGGIVRLAPNGTAAGASSLNALTLAVDGNNVPLGSLDITNNAVTIAAPSGSDPVATILGYLQTGYDKGNWDGAGIQSSSVLSQPGTSIGYADGNTDTGTAGAPGTILVMDTWLGDLNLDGSVTTSDLATLTANLGKSGDWAHGDLNYDGIINGDDLSLLMLGAAEFKAGGSVPLPEPATASVFVIAAGMSLRRRRA